MFRHKSLASSKQTSPAIRDSPWLIGYIDTIFTQLSLEIAYQTPHIQEEPLAGGPNSYNTSSIALGRKIGPNRAHCGIPKRQNPLNPSSTARGKCSRIFRVYDLSRRFFSRYAIGAHKIKVPSRPTAGHTGLQYSEIDVQLYSSSKSNRLLPMRRPRQRLKNGSCLRRLIHDIHCSRVAVDTDSLRLLTCG